MKTTHCFRFFQTFVKICSLLLGAVILLGLPAVSHAEEKRMISPPTVYRTESWYDSGRIFLRVMRPSRADAIDEAMVIAYGRMFINKIKRSVPRLVSADARLMIVSGKSDELLRDIFVSGGTVFDNMQLQKQPLFLVKIMVDTTSSEKSIGFFTTSAVEITESSASSSTAEKIPVKGSEELMLDANDVYLDLLMARIEAPNIQIFTKMYANYEANALLREEIHTILQKRGR